MCVPVVKATTREAGSCDNHGHGAGVLKSRGRHRSPDDIVHRGVVGSENGGSKGGSTHRWVVVGVA